MNTAVAFVSNLGLGPFVFYPLVVTLIVVMALFAYDEVGKPKQSAIAGDDK
jgi:hypothetical protein